MPFNGKNEFQCKICAGGSFRVVKGITNIFLECTRCESTDEISRRMLGWDEDARRSNNYVQEL